MIDTWKLQIVIGETMPDKNLVHSSVRKAGKQPDFIRVNILRVETHSDYADLEVVMGYSASRFVHSIPSYAPPKTLDDKVDNGRSNGNNILRLKWLTRVVEMLNKKSTNLAAGLVFIAGVNDFEFGTGIDCAWGVLPVRVHDEHAKIIAQMPPK